MKIKTQHWQIAWRKCGEKVFKMIQNPEWGWCADPFLVEYQGMIYLFAEIFLYKSERNGVIGYCCFNGNQFSEWQVTMDRHWHLSYPNVWVENGKLYMCPESYQLGEICIYELISFPDKWKKVRSLITDGEYCDTTFFSFGGKRYFCTFERKAGTIDGTGYVYPIKEDFSLGNPLLLSSARDQARCGGKFIESNGKLIRVAQSSIYSYGEGLVFYIVDQVEPEYKEHKFKEININNLFINTTMKLTGIHTYNRCGRLEVIDVRFERCLLSEYIARKRTHKVFLYKYREGL